MPMEQSPEVSALSIMYPESLVSLPITIRCRRAESRNTCAAALPMRMAISEVMGSWFATPLNAVSPEKLFHLSHPLNDYPNGNFLFKELDRLALVVDLGLHGHGLFGTLDVDRHGLELLKRRHHAVPGLPP